MQLIDLRICQYKYVYDEIELLENERNKLMKLNYIKKKYQKIFMKI